MTDADKIMNLQHFGSDLADIQIRIWINLEKLDSNSGSLLVEILALAEVCAFWAQSSI